VVLDIATSIVSYGTIKNYRLQGWSLPDDWMVGVKDGGPITDPARSSEGLLLPVGGYKGAGLALMLGLLAGSLNGAPFGRDVVDFNAHPGQVCDTGQFVIALDVSRFRPFADFISTVDDTLEDLRSSARLPGHDAIRLPGDHRHTLREAQMKNGVLLSPELTNQLESLAVELGIATLRGRIAAA
jgi:LDH2 family malate/lactate/ureidoglycolate dehydrogenase